MGVMTSGHVRGVNPVVHETNGQSINKSRIVVYEIIYIVFITELTLIQPAASFRQSEKAHQPGISPYCQAPSFLFLIFENSNLQKFP